mmetsp:Transcript_3972/g.9393  ORF Transcript_3972/g.9393 Transcript_3972/m.9393 type:complete len:342 (-) Transcript_3972:406-1431(-)
MKTGSSSSRGKESVAATALLAQNPASGGRPFSAGGSRGPGSRGSSRAEALGAAKARARTPTKTAASANGTHQPPSRQLPSSEIRAEAKQPVAHLPSNDQHLLEPWADGWDSRNDEDDGDEHEEPAISGHRLFQLAMAGTVEPEPTQDPPFDRGALGSPPQAPMEGEEVTLLPALPALPRLPSPPSPPPPDPLPLEGEVTHGWDEDLARSLPREDAWNLTAHTLPPPDGSPQFLDIASAARGEEIQEHAHFNLEGQSQPQQLQLPSPLLMPASTQILQSQGTWLSALPPPVAPPEEEPNMFRPFGGLTDPSYQAAEVKPPEQSFGACYEDLEVNVEDWLDEN